MMSRPAPFTSYCTATSFPGPFSEIRLNKTESAAHRSHPQEISTTIECTYNKSDKSDQVCKHLVPYKVNSNSYTRFTVQLRDKRPTHTQNARTIFAQTRVEKCMP